MSTQTVRMLGSTSPDACIPSHQHIKDREEQWHDEQNNSVDPISIARLIVSEHWNEISGQKTRRITLYRSFSDKRKYKYRPHLMARAIDLLRQRGYLALYRRRWFEWTEYTEEEALIAEWTVWILN